MSEFNITDNIITHPAFTPIRLKNMLLPGRIIRSATEFFNSDQEGHIGELEFETYRKLADQPLGMIICGHTCVSPEGRSDPRQNAIWSDDFIDDHRRVVDIVRGGKGCAKIVLQIGHGGMKAEGHNSALPVYTPDNMSKTQIRDTVTAFADASYRAKQSGFDGVQLHCAHMYLLSQFFYPQYNHRTDEYGGNGLNRFRITVEICEEIQKRCGDNFPVFIKINGDNIIENDTYFTELCEIANICDKLGMEGLELSGYNSQPPGPVEKPYFIDTALKLKNHTSIPIMLVGGIRTKEDIEYILSQGIATVSMARPFIKNPGCILDIME